MHPPSFDASTSDNVRLDDDPIFVQADRLFKEALAEYGAYLQQKGWVFVCHHLPHAPVLSEKSLCFFPDPWTWLRHLIICCHDEIGQTMDIESEHLQDQVLEFCLKKTEYVMPYRLILQEILLIPDFKAIQILHAQSLAPHFSVDAPSKMRHFFQIHHTALCVIWIKGLFAPEDALAPMLQNNIEVWFKTFYPDSMP